VARPNEAEDIYNLEKGILENIANDPIKRQAVLENNTEEIINFVNESIPSAVKVYFDFDTKICDLDKVCALGYYPGKLEVYTSERVISSTLTSYNPKLVKIFMWRTT
jgi:hypothetical protein